MELMKKITAGILSLVMILSLALIVGGYLVNRNSESSTASTSISSISSQEGIKPMMRIQTHVRSNG